MSQAPQIDASVDYYEVLQVAPDASREEINRAFRRLVLEFHPDKNPHRREESERRIRELIEANEILGDEEKRATFDRMRRLRQATTRQARSSEPFFFRKRTPGARALLILHLLLHEKPGEAATILAEEEQRHGFDFLLEYLDQKDYLDCLFLLAEHFVGQKDYLEAVRRLREFWRHEKEAKYRRHYFDEVLRMLKDLYLRKLPRVLSPQSALHYLQEAQELQLNRQENVLRLKRLAESQARIGETGAARETLARIQDLDPDAKGLDRIEALLAG